MCIRDRIILAGVGVCVLGIVIAGFAGKTKESEMSREQKLETVREFNFRKGILVATFSGIMSACFSFGLDAGTPIKTLTMAHGTPAIWQGLPVLIVILLGGFTTNFVWCALLNWRNSTGYQYFSRAPRRESPPSIQVAAGEGAPAANGAGPDGMADPTPVPLGRNYFFSALAGVVWYFQFFFYSMGESQMGAYKFSSWTLHMASIIIFSSMWGIALREWKGASGKARGFLFVGLAMLIFSTIIVGYGNYVGAKAVPG